MNEQERIGQHVEMAAQAARLLNPDALARSMEYLLKKNRWKRYIDPLDLSPHTWENFGEFCNKRIGMPVDVLAEKLRSTPGVAGRVADLAIGERGHPNTPGRGISQSAGSTAVLTRRLQRERPDLAGRVERKEMAPTRAAIEAGWEKPRIKIRVDSVNAAVKSLLKHFSADEIRQALEEMEAPDG